MYVPTIEQTFPLPLYIINKLGHWWYQLWGAICIKMSQKADIYKCSKGFIFKLFKIIQAQTTHKMENPYGDDQEEPISGWRANPVMP